MANEQSQNWKWGSNRYYSASFIKLETKLEIKICSYQLGTRKKNRDFISKLIYMKFNR